MERLRVFIVEVSLFPALATLQVSAHQALASKSCMVHEMDGDCPLIKFLCLMSSGTHWLPSTNRLLPKHLYPRKDQSQPSSWGDVTILLKSWTFVPLSPSCRNLVPSQPHLVTSESWYLFTVLEVTVDTWSGCTECLPTIRTVLAQKHSDQILDSNHIYPSQAKLPNTHHSKQINERWYMKKMFHTRIQCWIEETV